MRGGRWVVLDGTQVFFGGANLTRAEARLVVMKLNRLERLVEIAWENRK
jgi:hypothetical protein